MDTYEKKYKEALAHAREIHRNEDEKRRDMEWLFPELAESEDERIRKAIHIYLDWLDGRKDCQPKGDYTIKDMIAWLEKQGEFKSSKWTEGDVVRHGGVLALVTNGRNAMKSNCEQITIQYPDEWVKAEKKERKYFFEELEKQGEQKPVGYEEV